MREFAALEVLSQAGPEQLPDVVPSIEYVDSLYYRTVPGPDGQPQRVERFATELDTYVGVSSLAKPYGAQQLTVGQLYYRDHHPELFDEPDKFIELNRTIMNVWLFDLAADAHTEEEVLSAYQTFTSYQQQHPEDYPAPFTLEDFNDLRERVQDTVPPELRELFTAYLIYRNRGKSSRIVSATENRTGKRYIDHDHVALDMLAYPELVSEFMPSFLGLPQEEQRLLRELEQTGFHTPQAQQRESLAYHFVPFQGLPLEVQKFGLLADFFVIAGARGARIQNGSATADHQTYLAFTKLWEANFAPATAVDDHAPTPAEQALFTSNLYLEKRNEDFGFDLSSPSGTALANLACQFRNHLSLEEARAMPDIFSQYLNETTQELLTDLLNATGLEEPGSGAIWIQYAPDLVQKTYLAMRKANVPYEHAMASTMTLLAQINAATRQQMDVRQHPVTEVSAREMVAQIDKRWRCVLEGHFVDVEPVSAANAKICFKPIPRLQIKGPEGLPTLTREELHPRPGHVVYVGGGAGSDAYFGLFLQQVIGEDNMTYASLLARPREITNAEQIAENVFLANPHTDLHGARGFEPTLAAHGQRVYIIRDPQASTYTSEFQTVIQHASQLERGGLPAQIILGDSGGDILLPPQPLGARPNRDHVSLRSLQPIEEELRTRYQREGLGDLACRVVIFVPGVDGPENINEVVHAVGAKAYDLAPHTATFLQMMRADYLPSSDPARFSRMLSVAHYAYSPQTLQGDFDVVQPLHLPVKAALARHAPRPTFDVITRTMRYMLEVDSETLRTYLNLAAEDVS